MVELDECAEALYREIKSGCVAARAMYDDEATHGNYKTEHKQIRVTIQSYSQIKSFSTTLGTQACTCPIS